jgi:hypothetical protein
MAHRLKILTLLLALLISSLFLATPAAVSNGNFAQTTDAAANCTYSTSPVSEFTPPSANQFFTNVHEGRGKGMAPNDPCYVFLYWTSEIGPSFSYSAAIARANFQGLGLEVICKAASDPECSASKFPNGQFKSLAGFYKCESDKEVNCISGLVIIDKDGKEQAANFERHFPDAPIIPASDSPELNYPKGGSPILWSFSTSEGKKYIHTSGIVERTWASDGKSWSGKFPGSASFHFGLNPVNLRTDSSAVKPRLKNIEYTSPDGIKASRVEFSRDTVVGLEGDCGRWIAMDTGYCLTQDKFLAGYKYRVTFQVPPDQGFFLNGRLDAPVAYTEPLGSNRKLVIEGAPATLFAVSGTIPKKYLTPEAVQAIKSARDDFPRQLQFAPADFPPQETRYPDLLTALLPYFGDRTTFELQAWTLVSTPSLGRFANQCTNGGRGEMLGIISTNATAFDGDPPILDPATKILSYKVAAPHFAVDGKTENIGKYYMNMNANFIKCILGVDKVPAVAQIGITSSGQAERVSTVTVKTDKDWLRLNVDNFTFSSPKINVKFEAPESTPAIQEKTKAANIAPKVKAKTITCVKGKATKKVTGANPKCPVGYKKK